MKTSTKLIILGVIIAIVASYMVYSYLKKKKEEKIDENSSTNNNTDSGSFLVNGEPVTLQPGPESVTVNESVLEALRGLKNNN